MKQLYLQPATGREGRRSASAPLPSLLSTACNRTSNLWGVATSHEHADCK